MSIEHICSSILVLTIFRNEFYRYIETPPPTIEYQDIRILDISDFPRPNIMALDTFAVSVTGAGVKRVFSRSGRVAI